MRSKSASVKPSAYPALPYNIIRAIALLASIVVAIILAVFIYHLHADGYKLPFAFLIVRPPPFSPTPEIHQETNKITQYQLPPAPHHRRLLPPQCPFHSHHQLLLRLITQTLHNLQHPPSPPLARIPRRPKLLHVRYNSHKMLNGILGKLNRNLRLPHL